MENKINVSILGKGEEMVDVSNTSTIDELRNLLALDSDIIASDDKGNELSSTTDLSTIKQINFVPNVQGGNY